MAATGNNDPNPSIPTVLAMEDGTRVVGAGAELIRALHFVFEAERPGYWAAVMKRAGIATGKAFAAHLDAQFASAGNLRLASMPLAACLEFLVRHVTEHGWGRLSIDATGAAEHGVVVAHLMQSFAAETLTGTENSADPLLAGMLQGYFEHVTGQTLGCEEIACMRQGAPQCTFVLATTDRLQPILPFIGVETADQIIARLRH